jgi:hypothetical protein
VQLRPGARLRSQVSDVAVVVVSVTGDVVVECGGVEMLPIDGSERDPVTREPDQGVTLLGKRYADPDGCVEVLCTKGGPGALTCQGRTMQVKDAKALPSSD